MWWLGVRAHRGDGLLHLDCKARLELGSELLFDYGDGFGVDVLDFED